MNNETPALPLVDKTTAEIGLLLSKAGHNYGQLLQQASNITFRKDNLEQDFAPLKKVREVEKLLKDLDNPYTAKWQEWNASRKSLVDPLTKVIAEKTTAYKKLADELKADNLVLETEKTRKATIQTAISTFILDYSGKVAGATTEAALIGFEREINLEGTRTAKYQEFLPELKDRLQSIRSLISVQKGKVRQLSALKTQVSHASENGLDEVLLESMGKLEQLEGEIHENTIIVQETAINSQITAEIPQAEEVLPPIPKARRTTVAYEIVDIKQLQKYQPHMVQLVAVKDLVDNWVKCLKDQITDQKPEMTIDGVRIYRKSIY